MSRVFICMEGQNYKREKIFGLLLPDEFMSPRKISDLHDLSCEYQEKSINRHEHKLHVYAVTASLRYEYEMK